MGGDYYSIHQRKYARLYLGDAAYWFNRADPSARDHAAIALPMILCEPCAETALRRVHNFLG